MFDDPDLLMELLSMMVYDRNWLRKAGDLVEQDDFRSMSKNKNLGWILAGLSLDFFRKYRLPIGTLASKEIQQWSQDANASSERLEEMQQFLDRLKKVYDPARSDVLQEKFSEWKRSRKRRRILRQMVELEEIGELTDDKWISLIRQGVSGMDGLVPHDWMTEMHLRQQRRLTQSHYRNPLLMIDPLDVLVRSIGRGHLGLLIAPWKMGKSLALLWLAIGLIFQGFKVLFITLEDPIDDVEDRLDAMITELPIQNLPIEAPRVERRFDIFRNKVIEPSLRIIDGTETGLSVAQIEGIWDRLRTGEAFNADAIIIDYDDEIIPPSRKQDRRMEFADIYRELRKLAGRCDSLVWTAAQTNKKSEGQRIIQASHVAEDISKIRKATMTIGIGQGDWGPDSRYLNIVAHKFDKAHVGSNIWSDPEKGKFYDRARTLKHMQSEESKNE